MIKIREIEKAIVDLPPKQFSAFRAWFDKFDAVRWDRQFEANVYSGKLDALANKALGDFKKGKCKEL